MKRSELGLLGFTLMMITFMACAGPPPDLKDFAEKYGVRSWKYQWIELRIWLIKVLPGLVGGAILYFWVLI